MRDIASISRWQVIRNRKQILANPLPFHRKNFNEFGDIFHVDVGPKNGVMFTRDPEIIKHVLQKNHRNYHKSSLQSEDLAKYVGRGLLTSNGDFWRKHRRMIQPAFHKKKLEALLETMHLAIRHELKRLEPGQVRDAYPLMSDLAFQVVAKSLFSRSDIREEMNSLQEITETNQLMLIREMRQPYLKWWFRLSGRIGKHLDKAAEGRAILDRIIEDRIGSGQREEDLLDMLLDARYEDGSPMPRRQLLDEVLILFTAGHETAANALSFLLYLLATHPEKQEKISREAAAFAPAENGLMPAIQELHYTRSCIEEAMRLYPPAYFMDRVALEDDEIGGRQYKAGTFFLMSLFELHRHPGYWQHPDSFQPERFLSPPDKEFNNYYYPFGAGPRMCIGNNFAMFEMMMTLVEITANYKLETDMTDIGINPLITLKPGKVPIKFSAR